MALARARLTRSAGGSPSRDTLTRPADDTGGVTRRRLPLALALAAGVAAFGMSAAASIEEGATATSAANRIGPEKPALLVSDSAWLGIKTYGAVDAVQGFHHELDLGSCRRRVSRSCTNYDGHVPITLLEELTWRASDYETLIVATGYNDSDVNFRSDFERIVERARSFGYERIVWVTLREDVSYTSPGSAGFAEVFRNNNAALREFVMSGDYPELVIADWATYAADQDQWFASDGIHLRLNGPWAAADFISRKIAHLDGRPCPNPVAPGQPVQNPCPDPDTAPPNVDLDGLYPIGEPGNPTAGFFMEWSGSSSWPEPPWWED